MKRDGVRLKAIAGETRETLLDAAERLLELVNKPNMPFDAARLTEVHTLAVRLEVVQYASRGEAIVIDTHRARWLDHAKELALQCIGFLRGHPEWRPPQPSKQPDPEGWVHPRLWNRIEQVVAIARKSNDSEAWATVAREATVFLEGELRLRSGSKAKGRRQVALDTLKPGAACPIGGDLAEQEAWQQLGTGLLAGPGNEAAHHPGEQTHPYAMGVVGAVSLILAALDEQYGPPT